MQSTSEEHIVRFTMDDISDQSIHDELEQDGPVTLKRGRPQLGRRWKTLASVYLFIMSLKWRWRRRRKRTLIRMSSLNCHPCSVQVGPSPGVLFDNWTSPVIPIQNGPSSRRGSRSPNELCTGSALSSGNSSRRSNRRRSSGFQNGNSRRVSSVRCMWQNLTNRRKSNESVERRQSVLGVIDTREGYYWPTSVTRQLAFGPWENAASRSRLHGYLMKVPFAKVITLVIFFICVIVVTVIYVKEAEVEEKLKRKFGWID